MSSQLGGSREGCSSDSGGSGGGGLRGTTQSRNLWTGLSFPGTTHSSTLLAAGRCGGCGLSSVERQVYVEEILQERQVLGRS